MKNIFIIALILMAVYVSAYTPQQVSDMVNALEYYCVTNGTTLTEACPNRSYDGVSEIDLDWYDGPVPEPSLSMLADTNYQAQGIIYFGQKSDDQLVLEKRFTNLVYEAWSVNPPYTTNQYASLKRILIEQSTSLEQTIMDSANFGELKTNIVANKRLDDIESSLGELVAEYPKFSITDKFIGKQPE